MYKENIFTKIIKKEIQSEILYEDNFALIFKDIHPKAKIHLIAIPKISVQNFHEFMEQAGSDEVQGFFKAISHITKELGIRETGYRLITNCNENAFQEVFHLHFHILGGERLKPVK